jgi:hypothetical protein
VAAAARRLAPEALPRRARPRSCCTAPQPRATRPRSQGRSPGGQAQDVYAGPLTFRSRSSRLTAADVARARTEERDGPLTRPEIAERIAANGVELDSSTRLHIIGLAVTSGVACLGPDRGRTACLVLRQDWLGGRPATSRFHPST